jgi:hypothetical protein
VGYGFAKNTFKDGRIYEGMWVNDKRTGQGKMSFPDGRIEEGEFLNGKLKLGTNFDPKNGKN